MVNCYILGDPQSGEAIVVDPGGGVDRILMSLTRNCLRLKYIVNTHTHIDHMGGVARLKDVTKCDFLVHRSESLALKTVPIQGLFFGMGLKSAPRVEKYMEEGDQIKFGPYQLEVIHTPGHSPGGISLLYDREFVIVGDTLFAGSIGRTDIPGGSYRKLISSVKEKLFPLGDDLTVYPGHGPKTTIREERRHNPFFIKTV